MIPAIDLRGGKCVRLFRGDPNAQTTYEADPVETAVRFEQEGARRLHVVDLDAALGTGSNREVIVAICRSVAVPVQVGGGLRTMEAVERVLQDGAARAILGTAAALDPGFVAEAVDHVRDRVVVAVDVQGERLMVRGWQEQGPPLEEAVAALTAAGSPRFLATSVQHDGTMDGPDLALYERLVGLTDVPVIASGGVRKADDVWSLRELGVEAAVVGKALYSGTMHLSEVVRG
ncbi:MAG TPA: 1-(5-phosphoribosyl)-5-[(5-phosphoribosylamino)methylideneamino]imidazole-4-carboxamide isomerase [Actinomycetota bacterium]